MTLENRSNELILMNSELSQHKTNHILHLILTILTAGLWSFFWIVSSASTVQEQNKIRRRHKVQQKTNIAGVALCAWVGIVVAAVATMN